MKTCSLVSTGTPQPRNPLVLLLLLAPILALAPGCNTIQASLKLHSYVAVKVPGGESQIPKSITSTNGWKFVHLAACQYETRTDEGEIIEDAPAQWYLAFKTKNGKPQHVPKILAARGYAKARQWLPDIADATRAQFGVYPITLEVVNVLDPLLEKTNCRSSVTNCTVTSSSALKVGVNPHVSWPVGGSNGVMDPMWHLGSGYSQLAAARERVKAVRTNDQWKVRVGILDTGFDGNHIAAPRFIDEEEDDARAPDGPAKADAWNLISCALGQNALGMCQAKRPSLTDGPHGTGTIGILAGRDVHIPAADGRAEYRGPLGAVPEATIVPVRIAPWVFSINTANFAYAIDYASRVKECDVISMSHGGSPSLLWYDTINSAYWRGTALVAATGDFISFGPYKRELLPVPPSAPVYPAAARRVLGVTAATADNKTYAAPTWGRFLKSFFYFKPFDSSTRGSYGADGSWRNTVWSNEKGDLAAINRQGEMRIHPIAGYAPNVPWLVPDSDAKGQTNVVDLDGGGTSSSTPQVAAAAALWLEYYRKDWTNLPAGEKWKKPEAVYQALLRSADRPGEGWPDIYLGAGYLKANAALDRSFDNIINAGPEKGFKGFERSPRDFFDGDKSLSSTLSRVGGDFGPEGDFSQKLLNELLPPPALDTPREEALFRCYFNTRMVQAWHQAETPDCTERQAMKRHARKAAAKAMKQQSQKP